MHKNWKKLLIIACLAFASCTTSVNHKAECFPENDQYIAVGENLTTAMDETVFNHVINVVEELYKPIVKKHGGNLEVVRKWTDGTVNAYAQQIGSTWKVSMFGGLARHAAITPDGFALVVCHEIGHHIGGAPKNKNWWGSIAWSSNEGQSDYWGSTKCLKRIFKELEEEASLDFEDVDYKFAEKECDKRYADQEGKDMCVRASMAGKSLALLFKDLRKMKTDIRFNTPDKKVVVKTYNKHPEPQCRIDTYLAGALCYKSLEDVVSNTDESKGVCYRGNGYSIEARPLCWFAPKK